MEDIVRKTATHLFEFLRKEKEKHGKVTDEALSLLNCLFPTMLVHSLDLVDRKFITKFLTPAKREFFQVKGSSGIPYCCFPSCSYCSCPSYLYTVLLKKEAMLCKHLLAMELAIALDDFITREISDEEFVAYVAYETESPVKKEEKSRN
ncbi:zinc finger SWIM domain-containing protein 7-like [Rhopilema esculentum]|uniref:zinc finger SWIM domain-containing protein 7-like n=1 Tax=Rhopilema esculentum TaxID=499914 RepID=UPI0031DCB8B5